MMYTGNFAPLTLCGIETWVKDENESTIHKSLYSQVATVETTSKLFEDDATYSGIGYPELVGEAAASPEEDLLLGYTWRYTKRVYKKKMAVSKLLQDVDLYGVAKAEEKSRELGRVAAEGRDVNFFSIFRRAFDPEVVYGDGVPLISVQHPRKDGGAAQSNTFSDGVQDALSYTAVKELEDVMYEVFSNSGTPLNIGLNSQLVLMVPPYLREEALQISQADGIPETDTHNLNYFKGRNLDVLVNPYISWRYAVAAGETTSTDRATYDKRYFLLDSAMSKKMLKFKQLKNFEIKSWEDYDTDVTYAKVADVYAYGISGWYGITGSLGDGTTVTA